MNEKELRTLTTIIRLMQVPMTNRLSAETNQAIGGLVLKTEGCQEVMAEKPVSSNVSMVSPKECYVISGNEFRKRLTARSTKALQEFMAMFPGDRYIYLEKQVCSEVQSVVLPRFFDSHVHLRGQSIPKNYVDADPDAYNMLDLISTDLIGLYDRFIAMPNVEPVVDSATTVFGYRRNIENGIGRRNDPRILMTMMLTQNLDPNEIRRAQENEFSSISALKLMPQFRNKHGIKAYDDNFRACVKTAEELKIPIIVHVEKQTRDPYQGEFAALRDFEKLTTEYPKVKWIMAHVSTKWGIWLVRNLAARGFDVFGQIAPHYALCDRYHYFMNAFDPAVKPYFHCHPLLNDESDARVILEAMLSGESCFGLGSDSAPWYMWQKLQQKPPKDYQKSVRGKYPPAGIYWHPEVLYSVLTQVFAGSGERWKSRLIQFACLNAENFHGLQHNYSDQNQVTMVEDEFIVPKYYPDPKYYPSVAGALAHSRVVPFAAGLELNWRVFD